jgi:hydrogenase maturation protease
MADILIAGIGNIFLGDDAFGSEVARQLAQRPWPDGVRVVDFGIRGLDLVYALLERHDAVILVDAVPRGCTPGTLYVIEPEIPEGETDDLTIQGHAMDPAKVLRLAATMGGPVQRVFLVGCEPASIEEMQDGLSAPVRQAVGEAISIVESLVQKLLCATVGSTSTAPLTPGGHREPVLDLFAEE